MFCIVKMGLVDVHGGLYGTYGKKVVPGTLQHIDELRDNEGDRGRFLTADGQGFFVRDDGGVDWVITREASNPVLGHLYDGEVEGTADETNSYSQIGNRLFFSPSDEEAMRAREADGTLVVDMDVLRLMVPSPTDEEGRSLPRYKRNERFLQFGYDGRKVLTADGYLLPTFDEAAVLMRFGILPRHFDSFFDAVVRDDERPCYRRIHVPNPTFVARICNRGPIGRSIWGTSLYSAGDIFATRGNEFGYLCGELVEEVEDAA